MAIAYVDGVVGHGFTTSIVLTKPAGVSDDDCLVALCYHDATVAFQNWTPPSGWTQIDHYDEVGGRDRSLALYYKIASSEGSTWTFSHDGSAQDCSASVVAFSGVDTSTPLDVTYARASHYLLDNAEPPTCPNITTSTDGAEVVVLGYSTHNYCTAAIAPSGYTMRVSVIGQQDRQQFVASMNKATAGSEVPGDWGNTYSNTATGSGTFIVALKPSSGTDVTAEPGAGSLSLTGYAPTVISGDIAELPIILGPTLEITGYPPIAYIQEHIDVGAGSLSLVGRAPTVLLLGSSGPPAGSLTLEGYAPTVDVTTSHIVSPDTGSLSLSGHAPGSPSGPSTQPDVGSLQLTGYAPTVGIYQLITIEVLLGPTLSLVGYAPTAVMTEHWYPKPETGALTLTGHQPTVFMGANRGVSPGAGSLSLTGHAPVALLDGDLGLGVPDGSLGLTGYAPTVVMTDNKIIPIEAGSLALTGYAPTIYTGVPLVASKVNGIGI